MPFEKGLEFKEEIETLLWYFLFLTFLNFNFNP